MLTRFLDNTRSRMEGRPEPKGMNFELIVFCCNHVSVDDDDVDLMCCDEVFQLNDWNERTFHSNSLT